MVKGGGGGGTFVYCMVETGDGKYMYIYEKDKVPVVEYLIT